MAAKVFTSLETSARTVFLAACVAGQATHPLQCDSALESSEELQQVLRDVAKVDADIERKLFGSRRM